MAENRVKSFLSTGSYNDLENEINQYCRRHDVNPISVSVIWAGGTYVAFVVIEGR